MSIPTIKNGPIRIDKQTTKNNVRIVDVRVDKIDMHDVWQCLVILTNSKKFVAKHRDRQQAILDAKAQANDYIKGLTFSNDKVDAQPEPQSLASDLREQEKVMAGLIEKAKREGLDGRLLAMANTKFEFGFMALEKALNTNKG